MFERVTQLLTSLGYESGSAVFARNMMQALEGVAPASSTLIFARLEGGAADQLSLIAHCGLEEEELGLLPFVTGQVALSALLAGRRTTTCLAESGDLSGLDLVLDAHPEMRGGVSLNVPALHAGQFRGVLQMNLRPLPVGGANELLPLLDLLAIVTGLWLATRARPSPLGVRQTTRNTRLTHRQMLVLRLLARGLTNSQIARQLSYSVSTIKGDLATLYRVTHSRDREDLLERASSMGLLGEEMPAAS